MDDETSPLYCDPLYAEEYSYSILSKKLAVRKPTQAPLVAEGANQVPKAEGSSTAAPKAHHESGISRGLGATGRKGTASSATSQHHVITKTKNSLEMVKDQQEIEINKQEAVADNEP